MRASKMALAIGLSWASLSVAAPTDNTLNRLALRAVSPDNTCGASSVGNYTCDSTNAGTCCSASGYCGSTSDYCAVSSGCQSAYGTCTNTGSTSTCGQNGGATCATGLCCSGAGYCGNTTDYCGAGCQSSFGGCSTATTSSAGSSPTTGGGNELCGPTNGGTTCSNGQCCSVSGYCGTTQDYCSDPNNCNPNYGVCDSSSTPAGPSTINAPRPLLGSITYDDDIYDCVQNNVVALSYDDGPYIYTEQLLDVLKTYGFTATFFITGNNNAKGEIDITAPYPALIKRMVAEGHQVASHTYSHYSLSNITHDQRIQQMVKNEMAFNNIIGKWPTYMRPPYSQCDAASGCQADMKTLGYHRVYFDLDTQDYLNPLPSQVQNSKTIVMNALADQSATDYLAIQHDIVQQSVANLSSYFFDQIVNRGWKGVTVGECLGDDASNWYRSLSSSSAISSTSQLSSSSTSAVVTTTALTTSRATSSSSSTVVSATATSKPVTSSTTSKPTSSSSSTTTSKPSTTSPTTTRLPTTTTTSTTSATPSATCAATVGKWCGKIDRFNDKQSCQTAVRDCNTSYVSCVQANGVFNPQAWVQCAQYQTLCGKLSSFCNTCGNQCTNAKFGY